MSQVIVLPIQKISEALVKANLRPKNFCLGLTLPFTSVWDTFCIGKTMTCDLYFSPAELHSSLVLATNNPVFDFLVGIM